jgi:uncharacterized protein with PIN domain
MMEEMEVLLDEYLDWYEREPDVKFRDIEEAVLRIRQKMGAKLAEAVVETERNESEGRQICPDCGQVMRNKGVKGKTIVSMIGEVKTNRGYYYCPHCQSGHFPPGSKNGDGFRLE